MKNDQAGLFDFDPDNVGDEIVCGVDEAGRGPLAGPVFAAAVILDPSRPIDGLRDSKKLTAERREELAIQIRENALAWAVAKCSEAEIDRLNILQASMMAMRRVDACSFGLTRRDLADFEGILSFKLFRARLYSL